MSHNMELNWNVWVGPKSGLIRDITDEKLTSERRTRQKGVLRFFRWSWQKRQVYWWPKSGARHLNKVSDEHDAHSCRDGNCNYILVMNRANFSNTQHALVNNPVTKMNLCKQLMNFLSPNTSVIKGRDKPLELTTNHFVKACDDACMPTLFAYHLIWLYICNQGTIRGE